MDNTTIVLMDWQTHWWLNEGAEITLWIFRIIAIMIIFAVIYGIICSIRNRLRNLRNRRFRY